jgi:hypothetical protein
MISLEFRDLASEVGSSSLSIVVRSAEIASCSRIGRFCTRFSSADPGPTVATIDISFDGGTGERTKPRDGLTGSGD